MAMIRIQKKGYTRRAHRRKAFRKKNGTVVRSTVVKSSRVSATSFLAKDRGKKGRGKRVIPPLKRGALGVSFSWPTSKRRAVESKQANRVGERTVVGRLRAIQNLSKRTNPIVSKKAKSDAHYIAGSFEGKKRVFYPRGFK